MITQPALDGRLKDRAFDGMRTGRGTEVIGERSMPSSLVYANPRVGTIGSSDQLSSYILLLFLGDVTVMVACRKFGAM
jgi:hypothetical protein